MSEDMYTRQLSIEEMCAKMDEAFTIDSENENEGEGLSLMPTSFFKGLYWSAEILSYLNRLPSARTIRFPYDEEKTIGEAAEDAVSFCMELILEQMKKSDGFDADIEGFYFTSFRFEILSFFPFMCEPLDTFLLKHDMYEIYIEIGKNYPLALLRIVLDLIDYTNKCNPESAEVLFTNYLKNCYSRYRSQERTFSFICCVSIWHCAFMFRSEYLFDLCNLYIPLVNKETCLKEYSDVLGLATIFVKLDSKKAEEMLQEALEIRLLEFSEFHALVGNTYCQIAAVYYFNKKPFEAIHAAIKAYKAFPEHQQTIPLGFCLLYLVHHYYELRKFEEIPQWLDVVSNIYYKNKSQPIELYVYHKNQSQPSALDLYLELCFISGTYYMTIQEFALSEKHFNDGIIAAETNDPANETLKRLKTNFSLLIGLCMGDMQSAFDMLAEHVSQNPSVLSGEYVASRMFMNAVYFANTSEEAELYAKQSIDEASVHQSMSTYFQKLMYAKILLLNQKHHSLRDLIAQLIDESERELKEFYLISGGNFPVEMVELNTCKALFAYKQNDYMRAEQFALEAVHLSADDALRFNIQQFCGSLFFAMGKIESALEYYRIALETTLSRLNSAPKYINESRVRDYLNEIRVSTSYYFTLVTQDDVYQSNEEQYNIVLRTKSLPSMIEQVKKDRLAINSKQLLLLERIKSLEGKPNTAQQIHEAELEYAVADTTSFTFPEILCEDVQDRMPPNSALIEYFEYCELDADFFDVKIEERVKYTWYAVFITVKDAFGEIDFGRTRDVDALFVAEAASELREAIEREAKLRQVTELRDCRQSTKLRKQLYDLILKEVHPYLKGCKTLFIAPDSDLATIPFEILGKKGCLMDEFEIVYLETGRDINSNKGYVDMNGVSVVIGNPQYKIERLKARKRKSNIREIQDRGDKIIELPMSNLEAHVVAEKLGTQPLLKEKATKYAVLNCDNPKILHIATHGFVKDLDDEDERIPLNPMSQSYLPMAGALDKDENDNPPFGNGLVANEVAQKNLAETDLVVLSACVTGLGKKVYSEVVGMKVAFKIAGAKNTIVSLWHVDDFATAVFMDFFYTYLKNHDIHSALRLTKIKIRTVTVKELRERGLFSEDVKRLMGSSVLSAENLETKKDRHTPFSSERDWAGFICQQN